MSTQTNAQRRHSEWRDMIRARLETRPNWTYDDSHPYMDAIRHVAGLQIISTFALQADGKVWQHLSASYKDRVPNHREMVELKDLFIGEEKYAYAIYPPRSKYVNIHPNVLHLWHCCDGPVLPEFSGVIGGVRTI